MDSKISDVFIDLTDSLSKYRRANLTDDNGGNLIEHLYVDPLDNDLILKSMLKNNTTLLIGRKGTGKSTIINRFQHEIKKNNDKISLYLDIKSLFEQTKKSAASINSLDIELSACNREKFGLHLFFIDKVIERLRLEIKDSVFDSRFLGAFSKNGLSKSDFEQELDEIFDDVKMPLFTEATDHMHCKRNVSRKNAMGKSTALKGRGSKFKLSISADVTEDLQSEQFSCNRTVSMLANFFDIIGLMNGLKNLLRKVSIKCVFICLDDMSEIDQDSMGVFSNFIIDPLNNLSDEYFKFKISLYPGRDFLPCIDRQKVKTYRLDYYDLYSMGSVDKVELAAVKYTRRLIEKRFDYYFQNINLDVFFEITPSVSMDDYYKLLFQISSNVPRIIGKVLEIALQKTNGFECKITRKILQESAKQHYKSDIEFVLTKSEYVEYKTYNESFEQFHLLELLRTLIEKSVVNKKHIGNSRAKIFEKYTTNSAPSNYLYIPEAMEDILKTLEFNFFVTKHSQQKDKDGCNISIFSLNYGLCVDNNIIYDDGCDRKFRLERIFDCSKLLADWMTCSKELICLTCGCKYEISQKDVFIKHGVKCFASNCQGDVILQPVINAEHKKLIENNIRIQKNEYEILNALESKKHMTATELGNELDRPYQSINHSIGKNSKIKHYGFIHRVVKGNHPYFSASENGILYLQGKYI
ncbi:hypothetical protein [Shewanella benthica]|uniref:Uncharacterized protein n=1 Tax=Shewanella benthica KT99 TaxID=314608 RepID=A9DDX2_9GAMM|nr:hypothetical protein [Shewanella benthica]EDQ00060.1 hypothetical protein KT99_19154 [Shewanella benthica KT99]